MPIVIDGDPFLGLFHVYYEPFGVPPVGLVAARTGAGATRAAVRLVLDRRLAMIRDLKARHPRTWRVLHPEAEKPVDRARVFVTPVDLLDVYKETA